MKWEDRPALGTRIKSTGRMYRVGHKTRTWKEMYVTQMPLHGIYIGYRDLQNGRVESLGYEEGNCFVQTGTVRCALIVTHERANPIRVPFDGLELEISDATKN